MSYRTLPDRPIKKRLTNRRIKRYAPYKRVEIKGYSFQDLLNKNIRAMAHILKPGACSPARHSHCVMNIKATGENQKGLLIDFLTKVLKLSHIHQTIFCYVNVIEMTDKKLVAQVFGVWFDHLHTDIKAIAQDKSTLEQKQHSYLWKSSIVFKLGTV